MSIVSSAQTRRAAQRHRPLTVWTPPPELGRPRHRIGHPFGHDGLDLPRATGIGLGTRPALWRRVIGFLAIKRATLGAKAG